MKGEKNDKYLIIVLIKYLLYGKIYIKFKEQNYTGHSKD